MQLKGLLLAWLPTSTLVLISLGIILPAFGLLIFVALIFLDLSIVLYHEYMQRRER